MWCCSVPRELALEFGLGLGLRLRLRLRLGVVTLILTLTLTLTSTLTQAGHNAVAQGEAEAEAAEVPPQRGFTQPEEKKKRFATTHIVFLEARAAVRRLEEELTATVRTMRQDKARRFILCCKPPTGGVQSGQLLQTAH